MIKIFKDQAPSLLGGLEVSLLRYYSFSTEITGQYEHFFKGSSDFLNGSSYSTEFNLYYFFEEFQRLGVKILYSNELYKTNSVEFSVKKLKTMLEFQIEF